MREADLVEMGRRIQQLRKHHGYTQEQLADMMQVSIQMISNLERGNKAIRIDNLLHLSRILEVSTDYLLTGKESSTDYDTLTARIAQLSDEDRATIEMIVDFRLNGQSGSFAF